MMATTPVRQERMKLSWQREVGEAWLDLRDMSRPNGQGFGV